MLKSNIGMLLPTTKICIFTFLHKKINYNFNAQNRFSLKEQKSLKIG